MICHIMMLHCSKISQQCRVGSFSNANKMLFIHNLSFRTVGFNELNCFSRNRVSMWLRHVRDITSLVVESVNFNFWIPYFQRIPFKIICLTYTWSVPVHCISTKTQAKLRNILNNDARTSEIINHKVINSILLFSYKTNTSLENNFAKII